MNGEEIVRKFIAMGRAIYMATLESALEEGAEVKITIAIKEGDTNENI